jgi:superoxide dismutase, Cu-Zn family
MDTRIDRQSLGLLALLVLSGCVGPRARNQESTESMAGYAPRAAAQFHSIGHAPITGTVAFFYRGNTGLTVVVNVSGLSPGPHGFHILQERDCAADAARTAAHFNPNDRPHGNPYGPIHHFGDLPNLVADASGHAALDATLDYISLGIRMHRDASLADNIVGHAIVIDRDSDDFQTQPDGNSGPMIACGPIVANFVQR